MSLFTSRFDFVPNDEDSNLLVTETVFGAFIRGFANAFECEGRVLRMQGMNGWPEVEVTGTREDLHKLHARLVMGNADEAANRDLNVLAA